MFVFGSVTLEVLFMSVFTRIAFASAIKLVKLFCMQFFVTVRYLSNSISCCIGSWTSPRIPSGKYQGKSGRELCSSGCTKVRADAVERTTKIATNKKHANFFIKRLFVNEN